MYYGINTRNGADIYSGDDTVCRTLGHSFSSITSIVEPDVTCDNTTSSASSSQNCISTSPTTIATQSIEPISSQLGLHNSGDTQSDCSDELENISATADHFMIHASTNSTSRNSDEITNSTFISSNRYAPQPDNESDVLTQRDNAQVLHDSNSSHDFYSTVLNQSASSTAELALNDSLEKAKSKLKIKELKQFQISCITAI